MKGVCINRPKSLLGKNATSGIGPTTPWGESGESQQRRNSDVIRSMYDMKKVNGGETETVLYSSTYPEQRQGKCFEIPIPTGNNYSKSWETTITSPMFQATVPVDDSIQLIFRLCT